MEIPRRVRTRFAPSPTGFLHIGGVRSALYNELLAAQMQGDFILRIEDTDQSRFVPGSIEDICRSLSEIGIVPTEGVWLDGTGSVVEKGEYGPYIQSKRKHIHAAYAAQLIEMGKAYHCFCTTQRLEELRKTQTLMHQPTMYDGHCRSLRADDVATRIAAGESYVIRLRLPREGSVQVQDAIRGTVSFEWALIDDQVIVKSDGFPTYHLAAMCDDHDMNISHVIRGEEWLSSTPKHIFLYQCFGWEIPIFAHLPLLLNPDRSKLSKRQGDVAAHDFLDKGYLPEALLNFVALLGWNPTANRELYSHEELVALFDLHKINKAGAILNIEKLDWMNEQYLRSMPVERYISLTRRELTTKEKDETFIERCLLLVRDRLHRPQEVVAQVEPLLVERVVYGNVSLMWKQQTKAEVLERLSALKMVVLSMDDTCFSLELSKGVAAIESALRQCMTEKGWGAGDTFWPLRVALSGEEKSPSPFDLLWVLGKDRAIHRLDGAIDFLKTS